MARKTAVYAKGAPAAAQALAQFNENTDEAIRRAEQLIAHLKDRKSKARLGVTHYGDVGDVAKVDFDLGLILQFLGQMPSE